MGCPRLLPWPEWVIGQMVKRYQSRRVVAIDRRLVQGTPEARQHLLNTAYAERLKAPFRSRLAALARRACHLVRRRPLLVAGMDLIGTVYNFCSSHASLIQDGWRRPSAMAVGITDHCWSGAKLLWYRVPSSPWKSPRRKGW